MQMKKTNHQIKYILHKNVSITVKIKKYKYSRNYKVTYDKKNLQALVSIPNYITYQNGYKFALENIDWIYNQHIEICLLYTSPSPRDLSTSRMPSSA